MAILKKQKLSDAKKRFSQKGWISTWAEAAQSPLSADGNRGGATVAVRGGYHSEPMLGYECKGRVASTCGDLAIRTLKISKGEVLLAGGYSRGGHYAE